MWLVVTANPSEWQSHKAAPLCRLFRLHRRGGIACIIMRTAGLTLSGLLTLVLAPALAQQVPAPSRTVFKCEVNGKVAYSDSPCLGGQRLDVEPTRGMSKMSGAERVGSDVRQERHNEMMAEVLRPVLNETAEQRAKRHRRAKLSPADRAQCGELDSRMLLVEAEERVAVEGNRKQVQQRLLGVRSRYRELKC